MRNLKIWVFTLLLVLSLSFLACATEVKIGIVDMELVLRGYDKIADFQKLAEKAQEEIQGIFKQIQTGKIDSSIGRTRIQAIQEGVIQKQAEIMDEIYTAIEEVAKERKLLLITNPLIFYKAQNIIAEDISYIVIQRLNDAYSNSKDKKPHKG